MAADMMSVFLLWLTLTLYFADLSSRVSAYTRDTTFPPQLALTFDLYFFLVYMCIFKYILYSYFSKYVLFSRTPPTGYTFTG